jgi:uncharacterized protein YqgC (DUF456 family)
MRNSASHLTREGSAPMIDFLQFSILWLTLFFMLLGLLVLVVPVLPGLIIMWLAALGYGIVAGFSTLGIVVFVMISILAIGGSLVDNLLMGVGAKQGGASWWTILVAMLAGLLGTIFIPPFGGFVLAPLAILLLEYLRLRDWNEAWRSLRGLATGWGAAYFVRILIGLAVIGLWAVWVWQG